MIVDGWEFYILNPFDTEIKQTTQDKYMKMYNKAYDFLINELCIPSPKDLLTETSEFVYVINCSGENDIINLDESYDFKFLKSVFMEKKFKKIKNDIIIYYKSHDIIVTSMYKDYTNYYIRLENNIYNK